jgi:hypothetical protein
VLDRFYQRIEDAATIERPPALEGRMLSMVVLPKAGVIRPGGARPESEPEPATAGAAAEGDG